MWLSHEKAKFQHQFERSSQISDGSSKRGALCGVVGPPSHKQNIKGSLTRDVLTDYPLIWLSMNCNMQHNYTSLPTPAKLQDNIQFLTSEPLFFMDQTTIDKFSTLTSKSFFFFPFDSLFLVCFFSLLLILCSWFAYV